MLHSEKVTHNQKCIHNCSCYTVHVLLWPLVIGLLVVSRVYILILKNQIKYGSFYTMKIKYAMCNAQDYIILYYKAVRSVICESWHFTKHLYDGIKQGMIRPITLD